MVQVVPLRSVALDRVVNPKVPSAFDLMGQLARRIMADTKQLVIRPRREREPVSDCVGGELFDKGRDNAV